MLSSMLSALDRAYLALTKKELIQNVSMFFTPRIAYDTLQWVNLLIHLPLLKKQSAFCIVDCLIAMQELDSLKLLLQRGIHLGNERFIVKLLLPLRNLSDASFFYGNSFAVYRHVEKMNLLACAAVTNMSILIGKVVKLGGDVNGYSWGKPPILYAVSSAWFEATCALIQNGASVNKKIMGGTLTALEVAVSRKYNKIAFELVKAGAEMNNAVIRFVESHNRDESLAHLMLHRGAKVPDDCKWFKTVEYRHRRLRPRLK